MCDMAKDDQILIRLNSNQKQRWKNHMDEHGQYRDMTDLIEQSVEFQIADDNDQFTIDDDFDLVLDEIDVVKDQNNHLKELGERIERTQAKNQQLEDALERILSKIDKEAGNF